MSAQSKTKAFEEGADKKRVRPLRMLTFWKAKDPQNVTSAVVRLMALLNTPSQSPHVDPAWTTNDGRAEQFLLPESYGEDGASRETPQLEAPVLAVVKGAAAQGSDTRRRSYARMDSTSEEEEEEEGLPHCSVSLRRSDQQRRAADRYESRTPRAQRPSLLVRNTGQTEYVPWGHRDFETLVASLPPLKRGADPWVRRMEELTAKDQLSLGEVRALLLRAKAKLNEIEAITDTAHRADTDSFNSHRGRYWQALRSIWPTQLDKSALIGMEKKAGEEMYRYLQRAEEEWLRVTGVRHDRDYFTTWFWRTQVQKGLPQAVQRTLEEVEELIGDMEDASWRVHLARHLQRHQAKEESSQE